MKLIALILAFLLERGSTRLLHLRGLAWLDPLFDRAHAYLRDAGVVLAAVGLIVTMALPLIPVIAADLLLMERFHGLPGLAFSILVLVYSFGPRDLDAQARDYIRAVEEGDEARRDAIAEDLIEAEVPEDAPDRARRVAEAILTQANHRIFGVVLWFALLGPAGAWGYRVLGLMRHRIVSRGPEPGLALALAMVHGVAAWLPARLLALGYALAGSFEDAVADWRTYYATCAGRFFEINEDVVACSGCGALSRGDPEAFASQEVEVVASAQRLILRTLFIWLAAIAVFTLVGWTT